MGLVYDAAEQPIRLVRPVSGAFTYDGNLKRVKQVMDGETIYSVYGQSGVLLHPDNVTENKKTDYIKVAGHSIARVHGGNNIRYAHNDHLGSAISETTPSSQIRWTQNFTPFGEKRDSSGPNITDTEDEEGFTGHISDDKTGLTYMQARYYNPAWGRFLSNDPVGFSPSTPAMFGRYTYVHNDPISKIDPDGRIAGKAIKFLRNTKKAGGNPIKGFTETFAGAAEDIGTLLDGQLNGDDVTAAISLGSGLDKKDQAAIKGATAKARSAVKRRTSRQAQRNAGVATSKPGRDTKGRGFKEPRSQIKEGGASNGRDAGITDGSRDFNNDANHRPGMEAGEIKRNGPQTNSNGVPRTIGDTKGKSDFDDN